MWLSLLRSARKRIQQVHGVTVADVRCRLGSRYLAKRVVVRSGGKSYLKQIRAAGCGGNYWIVFVIAPRFGLEGIHVEVEFSVGADGPTPLAGQRFHVAD